MNFLAQTWVGEWRIGLERFAGLTQQPTANAVKPKPTSTSRNRQ